jgi:hypothetical protein
LEALFLGGETGHLAFHGLFQTGQLVPGLAALLGDQIHHVLDLGLGDRAPGGENDQVRALGDLRLVHRHRRDALAQRQRFGDQQGVGLQAEGRRRQPGRLQNPLHFLLGDLFPGHAFGGVAPVEGVFKRHGDSSVETVPVRG